MPAISKSRARTKALLRTAVFGVGVLAASPAFAQVCSAPVLGTITCPGGAPGVIVDIGPVVTPITVVLGDAFQTNNPVSIIGGDVTINTLTTATINTVNATALTVNSAADINARLTSITTQGDGALGAVLRAVDDVIFVADGTVSTLGNVADAINIQGRTVSVTGNIIRTGGNDSDAVDLVALDGPINLTANLLETNGLRSNAALLRGGGPINVNVGVLRTNGGQAVGLNVSNDVAACLLLGNGGCNNRLIASSITTNGFGSIGALVNAVGDTTINVDTLQTGGDEAAGLTLNANPTACAALGVGACDTAFTVNNLTTNGARAPGAVVRAAGNVTGNVRVLRTNGANAIGLDIASDPNACVLLGRGNCGTSLSIGQLTTNGAGSIGALIRAAGPTRVSADTIDTLGLGATGLDIAGDPTACVLLGAGACDVGLDANRVTTRGNGAAAVLINTPANVLARLGLVSTTGANSTGIGIVTNPAACIVLGPGACSAAVDVGNVNTGGDNSPGVDVTSPGPIDIDAGTVTTGGNNSDGIHVVGGTNPISVDADTVTTRGNDSDGIDVTGSGPIDIDVGTVTTGGTGSEGIVVDGGEGPITVDFDRIVTTGNDADGVNVEGTGTIAVTGGTVDTTGAGSNGVVVDGDNDPVRVDVDGIVTRGPNSDGIVVDTTTGNQTIITGPISVAGTGSDGVVANSGCATIDITATGAIASAAGYGIRANSACAVRVTTLPAAPVSGALGGIDVTSGTGATVTIGDRLASANGPALNVDGAAANVTIQGTGTLVGRFDLTGADDTLTNAGRIEALGDSSFGAGTDAFVNTGTLAIRPGQAAAGSVSFAGLESTANSGLIDLRNGVTGDTLTLPGTFTGSGNSRLGLDVTTGGGGTADRLIVGGAATGSTQILVNQLASSDPLLVNGVVLVDAGTGTSANAFALSGGPVTRGFVTYNLVYDAAAQNFALYGLPNAAAYETSRLVQGAREIFYRTNDAVGSHLTELNDLAAQRGTVDDEKRRSSALWMLIYGHYNDYDRDQSFTSFGQTSTVPLDYQQDIFGGQIGYDFGDVAGGGSAFGITGGYSDSMLRFPATADRFNYKAANAGVYGRLGMGAFYVNGMARYEHYWIDVTSRSGGFRDDLDGDAYGGKLEAGVRLGSAGFFAEPSASIEYVKTDLGRIQAPGTSFDFDESDGLRGKAGLRIGSTLSDGPSRVSVYAAGYAVHEFDADDDVTLTNNGSSVGFGSQRIGTYGQAKLGFSAVIGNKVSGFIESNGDYGSGWKGAGARGGVSIRF